ncbi:MAG: thymidylate synthase [Clostridiales bacterium]|jgi:thymidylate synthase|nr:thymidylate synthase [Clostridiales bacterium]
MSIADNIFIQNCKDILTTGYKDDGFPVRTKWEDGQPAYTLKKFGVVNRYDLAKEFPLITLRKTAFKSSVDELLWIWQKKSNDTKKLKSRIWDSWTDENGTIGKAYGYQLAIKYDFPEGRFDQVDKLLYDLKNNPLSRRIIASMYNFSDLQYMKLYPCAYSLTLNVNGGRLNAILNQRSQDMLVANNWNVCQYAVLVHMFAQVSGLEAGELVHVIADAHIYDRHIPIVEKIIENPVYDAPIFGIDKKIGDFYSFTADSFSLTGYRYTEQDGKIPVAI